MNNRRISLLTGLAALFLFSFPLAAQVALLNPGFETASDSAPALAASWKNREKDGFAFSRSADAPHSGAYSLCITGAGNDSMRYTLGSQRCPVSTARTARISISFYIRTVDVAVTAAVSCQLYGAGDQKLSFASSAQQLHIFNGTKDWTPCVMTMAITPDVKELQISALLQGNGKAFFDDFAVKIEDGASGPPSKEVKRYSKALLGYARKASIFKDSLDWKTIENDVNLLSAGMKSTSECSLLGDYMIGRLRAVGDKHSFILKPSLTEKMNSGSNLDGRQPSGEYLGNGIGYIKVPGILALRDSAVNGFAEQIQQLIRGIDSAQQITSWSVDLRENSGGNMYPMIAGLGPLTGEGELGYFQSNRWSATWFYKNGKAGEGLVTDARVKNPWTVKQPAAKIAVLIGPRTASSGEMTAISFSGRPNTMFIGEPSGGYTTANAGSKLPDGSMFYLATSYTADRNKKAFRDKIEPGILAPNEKDSKTDAGLEAAKKWLLDK